MKLITWVSDIYKEHGYVAALITIVVLTVLIVGISYVSGISLSDVARWVQAL